MRIGADVGFGFVKVVFNGSQVKFPTALAYHTATDISEVDVVVHDGKEYVVGEDVRYEPNVITILTVEELINYYPVFLKYALKEKIAQVEEIAVGLPPKHKNYSDKLKEIVRSLGIKNVEVLPQGFGIFIDVKDKIGEEVLIVDVGFNTVDFLVIKEGKKKKGHTLEKMGILKAVEIFRDLLPSEYAFLKGTPLTKMLQRFEKGYTVIDGERIDLKEFKEKALQRYTEILEGELRRHLGDFVREVESLVFAGGGANLIKPEMIRPKGVIIPNQPEYSQARGYLRWLEER
ncbi:MAG TPA: ParM/StbA family protein [Aquifex aeolicus]|nr:ParM/StbA family protein [Aquifex aeolicus]